MSGGHSGQVSPIDPNTSYIFFGRTTERSSALDHAPRLPWTTLQYGAARPERLRRHAAHPELDAVGFELNEDGRLVIGAGGKELVPGARPGRWLANGALAQSRSIP